MLNVDKMALRWNISESNQPINQSINQILVTYDY